jgi:hypothetical protein
MLKPRAALLVKLGSIAVHADEFTSPDGFDLTAMRGLLNDPEVIEWLAKMTAAAFVPVKRKSA